VAAILFEGKVMVPDIKFEEAGMESITRERYLMALAGSNFMTRSFLVQTCCWAT
jgi:hypothetical protein